MYNNFHCIGGLVVKLAVAILHRTVSASPGFDSRPMQALFLLLRRPGVDGGAGSTRNVQMWVGVACTTTMGNGTSTTSILGWVSILLD